MCGRYYVDDDTARAIERLVEQIDTKLARQQGKRDIMPSQMATIIRAGQLGTELTTMNWGFPAVTGSGLVINGRVESVNEKPMFRQNIISRRCIIPAAGFYEWNEEREKFTFDMPDTPVIYLAGIWNSYQEQDRFVILTTQANASMKPVHDRMPLLLDESEIISWLYDKEVTTILRKTVTKQLRRTCEHEQMKLDLQ